MAEQPEKKNIQLKISDDVAKGFYSNGMQLGNTKEEFVLDFMNILGNSGIVGSRVIVSPNHMKRIAMVMNQRIKKYEEQFGTIKEGESPSKSEFGFNAQS